jgi:16S rRNA (cytosine1402-N4)-methyltransferase
MNKGNPVTAADLLKNTDEAQLADIFYNFGELKNSRQIAREIVAARSAKPLTTAKDIMAVTGRFAPFRQEHKFYARVFQALRIAVNNEIENLKDMLAQSLAVLKSGGRLVVITYHSLEDRIVKNFMRTGNFEGIEEKDFFGNLKTPFTLITRKGITPDEEEIERNTRSRSARLRIAEKV